MSRRILVPLDGSPLAERALPYAESLARAFEATILLVRAVQFPGFGVLENGQAQIRAMEEAEQYLESTAAGVREHGVPAETATPYGRPAGWILEEVPLRHADVIVMATHGRSGIGRLLFGSVAESVLARSPVPVLLVRAWRDTAPRPIVGAPWVLVPVDGSAFSERALARAAQLATDVRAGLLLTRVVPNPAAGLEAAGGELAPPSDEEITALVAEARSDLQRLAQTVREAHPHLSVDIDVRVGDPGAGIGEAAEEYRAGVVVMATHGRSGVPRVVFGSVANDVIRHGTVPLLLVPRAASSTAALFGEQGAEAPAAPAPATAR